MNEVLSQTEIDNLLSAVEMDDFGDDGGMDFGMGCEPSHFHDTKGCVKMYDFKRPDKFSKDQIRTLQMIHETYARLNTTSLSAQLRSFVNVHVASVDQLTFEEFSRSIPNPTTLAIINMDPLKGSAIMELDPTITFAIIERLFGGEGNSIKENRVLTDIEQSVMEGVIIRMLGNLREAWFNVIGLRPKLGNIETNIQFSQIVPPNDMVVIITLETRIGDVEGMTNLCIPYSILESVMPKLSATHWYSSIKPSNNYNYNENVTALQDVTLPLVVNVGDADVPISTLLNLKINDTIKLNQKGSSNQTILINGKPKFESQHTHEPNTYNKRVVVTSIIPDNTIDDEEPEETFVKPETIKKLEATIKNQREQLQKNNKIVNDISTIIDVDPVTLHEVVKHNYPEAVKCIKLMLCDNPNDAGKIFIMLDRPAIFETLTAHEQECITFEISRIDTICPPESHELAKKFINLINNVKHSYNGGFDYAKKVLNATVGEEKTESIIKKVTSNLQVIPFDFVNTIDPDNIMLFVQHEHPQTIAVVLSYIDKKVASKVLMLLPIEVQADVVKRIIHLDRVLPEIVREIERVLERKCSTIASDDFGSKGGIKYAVDVLDLVDRSTEKCVVETLEEEDPELAEEIKKHMFVFEDIVLLLDRDIQTVINNVSIDTIATALKAVDDEVKEKIVRNCSKKQLKKLNKAIEELLPGPLYMVESCQHTIVKVIDQLDSEGTIYVNRGDLV